jgi:hypothetical protein
MRGRGSVSKRGGFAPSLRFFPLLPDRIGRKRFLKRGFAPLFYICLPVRVFKRAQALFLINFPLSFKGEGD